MFKKLVSMILTACITLFSVCPVFAESNVTDDEIDYGYVVDDSHRLAVSLSNNNQVELATSYDPRIEGIMTSVKSQFPYSICWMYASNSLVE